MTSYNDDDGDDDDDDDVVLHLRSQLAFPPAAAAAATAATATTGGAYDRHVDREKSRASTAHEERSSPNVVRQYKLLSVCSRLHVFFRRRQVQALAPLNNRYGKVALYV